MGAEVVGKLGGWGGTRTELVSPKSAPRLACVPPAPEATAGGGRRVRPWVSVGGGGFVSLCVCGLCLSLAGCARPFCSVGSACRPHRLANCPPFPPLRNEPHVHAGTRRRPLDLTPHAAAWGKGSGRSIDQGGLVNPTPARPLDFPLPVNLTRKKPDPKRLHKPIGATEKKSARDCGLTPRLARGPCGVFGVWGRV